MRLIISIIIIAVLSFIAEYFFPWWSIAIACFFVNMLYRLRPVRAFLAGFSGVFLLWIVVAMKSDFANDHILSAKMAELIFHSGNSALFIVVAALVGGIVGGLSGWSGALVRKNLF